MEWSKHCLCVNCVVFFLANRSLQENGDQKVESKIEEVSFLIAICSALKTQFCSFHIERDYLSNYSVFH